jgi:uncharacterized membrane protein
MKTIKNNSPAAWLLLLMIGVYCWVFGNLTWAQQSNFGTFGFDMGIYDQGIWLLSRFYEPFVTIRGLNFFGHHVNLITLLFVPFYWLGAGPHFLYLAETVMLAMGAIPVWLIARDRFRSSWGALIPAASYLLYPSLQWINWWHFHPDALIITPLLFAWWFQSRRAWVAYSISVLLALSCKEDAAIAIFMLGLLMFLWAFVSWVVNCLSLVKTQGRNNPVAQAKPYLYAGTVTMLIAMGWWFISTKLIIPLANTGAGPFYANLFPGFGNDVRSVIISIFSHPDRLWNAIVSDDCIAYYTKLFVPVAFLALLSPEILIGLPQLVVNTISAHGYTHDFKYHYTSIIIAVIFISSIEAVGRVGKRYRPAMWCLLFLLGFSAIYTNIQWSPSPLGKAYRTGIWAQPQDKHDLLRAALQKVPSDAGVTATYYIVPHLTHRRLIYEFPNPFRTANWGFQDKNPDNPDDVDFLVIDTGLTGSDKSLYQRLIGPEGDFELIFSDHGIEVAKRRE